ncbi:MAG: hypothetical protein U0572_01555 [Phycisphaerales bacterium]
MTVSRIGWAIWALVPVALLTFHFGPGQAAYVQDQAARLQSAALEAEASAMRAQDAAYAKHLAAIEARRAAFLSQAPDDDAKARAATEDEDRAYAAAAEEWKRTADAFQHVQDALGGSSPEKARRVRWAHARAMVRSGEIWPGIGELESIVDELDDAGQSGSALARSSREELATAYYYGARLLRLSGMPAQEWRVESGKARQQFRYLAEQAIARGETKDAIDSYQRNVELVLNLEQASLVDIQGKPLPRESPRAGNIGNRPGNQPGRKSQRPPQRRDARGAGGAGEIGDGW